MAISDLTAARLRELVHYEPDTGIFRRSTGTKINVKPTAYGYLRIRIDGSGRHAQRLAVLYMTGEMPPKGHEVDHINGVKTDNRWDNLRVVSVSVNQQNRRKAQAKNSTGMLGVSRCGKRYRAQIWLNQKNIRLGHFDTPEEAHSAYLVAKREMHAGNML